MERDPSPHVGRQNSALDISKIPMAVLDQNTDITADMVVHDMQEQLGSGEIAMMTGEMLTYKQLSHS